jgi:hypothetical protein
MAIYSKIAKASIFKVGIFGEGNEGFALRPQVASIEFQSWILCKYVDLLYHLRPRFLDVGSNILPFILLKYFHDFSRRIGNSYSRQLRVLFVWKELDDCHLDLQAINQEDSHAQVWNTRPKSP